jgi:hypothetical protein
MRNRGFLPKPHTVGDIAYIITGSETDDAHRMNGTRCRITADHGRGEYSWEVAPVTYSEIICLIEKLEREGKLPLGTWGLCPWSGLQLTEHGKEGRPGNLSCDVCDCSGFPMKR